MVVPEGLPPDAIPAVQQPTTGDAVAGSVKIAAAMKQNPNVMQTIAKPAVPTFEMPTIPDIKAPTLAAPPPPALMTPQELNASSKALDPFLKLGMDIAQGKVTW